MKKRVLQCLCPLPALLYLCFFLPIWGDHRFYPGGWDTGLVFGGMAFLFVVGVAGAVTGWRARTERGQAIAWGMSALSILPALPFVLQSLVAFVLSFVGSGWVK